MTSRILGLRTVIYKVDDLEKAKEWYNKVFESVPYFDEPFYVGYNIAGYELGLQPSEEKGIQKGESVLAYWGVENVSAEFNRMLSMGATAHEEPVNVGGDITVASVIDPWGNSIGIICNPDFKLPGLSL